MSKNNDLMKFMNGIQEIADSVVAHGDDADEIREHSGETPLSGYIPPHERFEKYDGDKCWQGHLREVNYEHDLIAANLSHEEAQELRTSDFEFAYVPKDDKQQCKEIIRFIERHEWLGKMPTWLTHRFTWRLNVPDKPKILCGVIIMATPNAFSNLMGADMRHKEKLIARGACISFGPKNLGSHIIMDSVKWMVKNTEFRFFTAYSDPDAKELGTIYQACSFTYLGQASGTKNQYFNPAEPEKGWRGDKAFTERSEYVRHAKDLGIKFLPEWRKKGKVKWSAIPDEIASQLKRAALDKKASCNKRTASPKHKYVCVMGRGKKETRRLRKLLYSNNPKLPLEYPKNRGE